MTEQSSYHSQKAGLPPGSLVYVGEYNNEEVILSEFTLSGKSIKPNVLSNISESTYVDLQSDMTWINLEGIHDTKTVETIGEKFNLDSMILEDIVNTQHRPKEDELDDYLFLSLRLLDIDSKDQSIINEQISLVLGKNFLVSFQERKSEIFSGFRKRLEQGKSNIRLSKVDYIFYRIIDTVVDNYFFVTEHISDSIDELEGRILKSPEESSIEEIYALKKKLQLIKKAILPLREAISSIVRNDHEFIDDSTEKYFRDVSDHLSQIADTLSTQSETIISFVDLFMSGLSTKMNQVMQVLTMFATIFIPLTFIAGVYGMNFENMPELQWKYGYLVAWGLMISVGLGFIIYFKRKKWL